MSDIVERLRTQIANASLGDRKYERPMTWDEADFVLSEIERLRAQVAALQEALIGVINIADRNCPEFRAARVALEEK